MEQDGWVFRVALNRGLTAFDLEENAILTWFDHWLARNLENAQNIWDNTAWLYQSAKKLTKRLNFPSEGTVRWKLKALSGRFTTSERKRVLRGRTYDVIPLKAGYFDENRRVTWYTFTPEFVEMTRECCRYSSLLLSGRYEINKNTLTRSEQPAPFENALETGEKAAKSQSKSEHQVIKFPKNGGRARDMLTLSQIARFSDEDWAKMTSDDIRRIPGFVRKGDAFFESYHSARQQGIPALRGFFQSYFGDPRAVGLLKQQ